MNHHVQLLLLHFPELMQAFSLHQHDRVHRLHVAIDSLHQHDRVHRLHVGKVLVCQVNSGWRRCHCEETRRK